MRYSLWSRGHLIGYTDLDIHTITPHLRQGFIEPVSEGKPLLEDATALWRAMAERQRARRARGGDEAAGDDELVEAALNRREALDLQLRDDRGEVFPCDFMRIYDLFDMKNGVVDEMGDTEEEEQAEFEIEISRLAPEQRAEALARRADLDAEIEEFVAEWKEERAEKEMFGSEWPPFPPEDPRWETMQYHLQVYLERRLDDDWSLPGADEL